MDTSLNAEEASWKLLADPGVTPGLLECANIRVLWRRGESQEMARVVGHSECLGQ